MVNKNALGLAKGKHIHFIGIGGISMSGLAEILLKEGYHITGSDMKASATTMKLLGAGIKVFVPHSEQNIANPDLIVYTAAVKEDNPELQKAAKLGIPCIDRATLLGEILDRYDIPIAVAGTHGKTTTTSMITQIMVMAGVDPTAHIGGILPMIQDSTLVGGKTYFITEACEYVESFLKFNPKIATILNIEADHLDYFTGLPHVMSAFLKFAQKLPADGTLIANVDDENVRSLLPSLSCKITTYSVKNEGADWTAEQVRFNDEGCAVFNVLHRGKFWVQVTMGIPGMHNLSNALAAIAACVTAHPDLSPELTADALSQFKGAVRRFQHKGTLNGIRIVDDYAHHPTEIRATLQSAKDGKVGRLLCVFQPHTYTRTKALLEDFSESFDKADVILVSDIYAAREKNTGDIHATHLVQKLLDGGKDALYLDSFEKIVSYLRQHAQPGDLILTMGAGNIDEVGVLFLET